MELKRKEGWTWDKHPRSFPGSQPLYWKSFHHWFLPLPSTSRQENMAVKTRWWISAWFILSAPVVLWDAGYCFMRYASPFGGNMLGVQHRSLIHPLWTDLVLWRFVPWFMLIGIIQGPPASAADLAPDILSILPGWRSSLDLAAVWAISSGMFYFSLVQYRMVHSWRILCNWQVDYVCISCSCQGHVPYPVNF